MKLSTSTLAKIFGWTGAFLLYLQTEIAQQSVLPHDAAGWAKLVGAIALGYAVHHASNTAGQS